MQGVHTSSIFLRLWSLIICLLQWQASQILRHLAHPWVLGSKAEDQFDTVSQNAQFIAYPRGDRRHWASFVQKILDLNIKSMLCAWVFIYMFRFCGLAGRSLSEGILAVMQRVIIRSLLSLLLSRSWKEHAKSSQAILMKVWYTCVIMFNGMIEWHSMIHVRQAHSVVFNKYQCPVPGI